MEFFLESIVREGENGVTVTGSETRVVKSVFGESGSLKEKRL